MTISIRTFDPIGDLGPPPAAIAEWKNYVLDKSKLTPSERKIAEFLLKGLADKEIAEVSGLSVKTVKHHLHVIRRKMNVSSRGELFAFVFGSL